MLPLENVSQLAQVLATSEIKQLFDALPNAQLSSTPKQSAKYASQTAAPTTNMPSSINAWIFALITLMQIQLPSYVLIPAPLVISHKTKYALRTAPLVMPIHS